MACVESFLVDLTRRSPLPPSDHHHELPSSPTQLKKQNKKTLAHSAAHPLSSAHRRRVADDKAVKTTRRYLERAWGYMRFGLLF